MKQKILLRFYDNFIVISRQEKVDKDEGKED